MAFWTNTQNVIEPNRKYRFVLGAGTWWWIKSAEKPSFEVTSNEYQLINHKFKYPGIVQWNDITLTMIDSVEKPLGQHWYDTIVLSGYKPEGIGDGLEKTMLSKMINEVNDLTIDILSAEGKTIESWVLVNPFVKSLKMGDLDYSDDGFIEVTLVLSYDRAELNN